MACEKSNSVKIVDQKQSTIVQSAFFVMFTILTLFSVFIIIILSQKIQFNLMFF